MFIMWYNEHSEHSLCSLYSTNTINKILIMYINQLCNIYEKQYKSERNVAEVKFTSPVGKFNCLLPRAARTARAQQFAHMRWAFLPSGKYILYICVSIYLFIYTISLFIYFMYSYIRHPTIPGNYKQKEKRSEVKFEWIFVDFWTHWLIYIFMDKIMPESIFF